MIIRPPTPKNLAECHYSSMAHAWVGNDHFHTSTEKHTRVHCACAHSHTRATTVRAVVGNTNVSFGEGVNLTALNSERLSTAAIFIRAHANVKPMQSGLMRVSENPAKLNMSCREKLEPALFHRELLTRPSLPLLQIPFNTAMSKDSCNSPKIQNVAAAAAPAQLGATSKSM